MLPLAKAISLGVYPQTELADLKNLVGALISVLFLICRALAVMGLDHLWRFRILRARKACKSENVATVFFGEGPSIKASNIAGDEDQGEPHYPALASKFYVNALVTANRRLSAVVAENELLLPQAAQDGPWSFSLGDPIVGGLLRYDHPHVLSYIKERNEIVPHAIFIGSWTPSNWYHWLIDLLPSVYLSRKLSPPYSDWPVLIPEAALARKNWREPLFAILEGRPWLRLPADSFTRCKELLWIDSPSSPGPVNALNGSSPQFEMHREAMISYRDFMRRRFLQVSGTSQGPTFPSRIFIARRPGSERNYNQGELVEVAARVGFEPVFLEDYSFGDLVTLMSKCEAIVGPHGAGWASAIFCRPGTRGLLWTWTVGGGENWYSNLGSLSDMELTLVSTTGSSPENRFDLDPGIFEFELERLGLRELRRYGRQT